MSLVLERFCYRGIRYTKRDMYSELESNTYLLPL